MNEFDAITTFLGRAGYLYGQKNICPPFRLREFAEGWRRDGISFAHCIEQIQRHLDENSGQYRCGSGDGGLNWLDQIIRESWCRLQRPSRARPEQTGRQYNRGAARTDYDEGFVDRTDSAPRRPVDLKPVRAGLGSEPGDVPGHPSQMRTSPTSISDRVETAPNPAQPVRQKQIDRAIAFLRRELAFGEVEAAVLERHAKDEDIAPRTLQRARSALGVVSRRTGFGESGKFLLSLPKAPMGA